MGWRVLIASVLLLLAASACYQEPIAVTTLPPRASGTPIAFPPSPAATRTPRDTPEPTAPTPTISPTDGPTSTAPASPGSTPVAGSPGAGCVNGWSAPAPGSPAHETGLAILSGHLSVEGGWTVQEMRYFTGPELPNVEPQYPSVERWYVSGALVSDPNFRGRFLLERRTEQIAGISAVAPYASSGYQSPDWTGFIGEGPPTTYLGLPGQWSGIPYDFVTGAGDGGFPGLPEEVAGCLSGT